MAGGRGERFWPKSRNDLPKQFLALTSDNETMVRKTVNRIKKLIPAEDIFIVTNSNYCELVRAQISEIPERNILAEPCSKNTAPCIAYAAAVIKHFYGDAVMVVLPSDHLIRYEDMFIDTLKQAVEVAEVGNRLVTIGIVPTYPETGYGYIKFRRCEEIDTPYIYAVEHFVEKPDKETAKEYVSSGKYLWNSGMFVWKVSSVAENFKKLLPWLYDAYTKINAAVGSDCEKNLIRDYYFNMESISIDFGIMEKADEVFTLSGSFGWDDVGSWLAMERINRTNEFGNYVTGDVITVGTKDSIIVGGKKLIAVVGIKNVIVVDTNDATLICDKDSTQDIKRVTENLKMCNRFDLI